LLTKIEVRAPGIIQQNAARQARPIGDEERNAFVNRVGRFLKPVRVRIPIRKSFVAPIKRSGLITQAEIMLIERHGFRDTEAVSLKTNRLSVLLQKPSLEVAA